MYMKHQNKQWLKEQYFDIGKTQKQISDENGIKQVTVSKWLNIYFNKDELKTHWHYGSARPEMAGENHWTKRFPDHPFIKRLKEGLRLGAKQTKEEIEKRRKCNIGKKRSDWVKKKLSISKIGDRNPQTKMRGDKSPFWKKDKTEQERLHDRKYYEYHEWRKSVYTKDGYKCRKCGINNKHLNAHHIENYSDKKDKRLLVENGITFCNKCHKQFHIIYGKKNNNKEQVYEYIQN